MRTFSTDSLMPGRYWLSNSRWHNKILTVIGMLVLPIIQPLVIPPVIAKEYDWTQMIPEKTGTDWKYFHEAVTAVPGVDLSTGMAPYRLTVRRRLSHSEKQWDLVIRYGCVMKDHKAVSAVRFNYAQDRCLRFDVSPIRLTSPGYRQNEPDDQIGLYEVTLQLSNSEMSFLKENTAGFKKLEVFLLMEKSEMQAPFDFHNILERVWSATQDLTNPEVVYAAHFTLRAFPHPSLKK